MLRNVLAAFQMRPPTPPSTSTTHQQPLIEATPLNNMDTQFEDTAPITGLAATGAACQAVLATAELLEAIVLQLSPRQIMASQRVCKQFRDVVATSTMLKQKVFLAPKNRPVPEQKWVIEGNTRNFSYRLALPDDQGHQDARRVLSVVTTNSTLFESEETSAASLIHRLHYGGEWLRLRQELHTSVLNFIEGEPQSWKDFQITDPPCLKASVSFIIRFSNCAVTITTGSVSDANGVTLGTLLGAVPVHALRYPAYGMEWKYQSARQAVLRVQNEQGMRGRITFLRITLDGMIAPNESERRQVDRQGLGEGTRT